MRHADGRVPSPGVVYSEELGYYPSEFVTGEDEGGGGRGGADVPDDILQLRGREEDGELALDAGEGFGGFWGIAEAGPDLCQGSACWVGGVEGCRRSPCSRGIARSPRVSA
eukprot:768817-Hanusia_phi.AAC.7